MTVLAADNRRAHAADLSPPTLVGEESPGILWLASYPKSGNTWLRVFLANYFSGARRPVSINLLPRFFLGDNFLIHFAQLSGRLPDEITDSDIERLRPEVHRWFASARGETAMVKTHSLMGSLNGSDLITADATAGAIYVVRNPLDIAPSFAHHYDVSIERAVDAVCRDDNILPRSDKLAAQVIGSWRQHVASWLQPSGLKRHVVRYEDMIARPERTFGRLVRFLGLPHDRRRLRDAIAFSRFERLAAAERAHGFVEARPGGLVRFFRAGRAGAWRGVLDDSAVQRIVRCSAAMMARLDYLDDDGRPR